jgi:hypothetical protein
VDPEHPIDHPTVISATACHCVRLEALTTLLEPTERR